MSGYISGEADGEGPPSMTTLPAACARSAMSWICGACTCMPLTTMTSAHSNSADVAVRMFSSTKRTGHSSGI